MKSGGVDADRARLVCVKQVQEQVFAKRQHNCERNNGDHNDLNQLRAFDAEWVAEEDVV